MNKRIIGSNSHGFNNESLIVQSLNKQKLKELNSNLKKFIKDICIDNEISISDDMIVEARVESNNKLKQDFYITLAGKEFGISVKMGNGNSVHQEKIEEFIDWLSKVLNEKVLIEEVTDEIKDCFRFFIWADGSTNGQAPIVKDKNGNIIGRFGTTNFKKLFPKKREQLQKFLSNNEEVILNRAIFEGKYNSKVDYVYHGNPNNGVWISKKEILEYNIKNSKSKDIKNKAAISVGRSTVQPWNPSLRGTKEDRRGQIQFKYGSIVDDFEKLMHIKASNIGTFEGDREEFNLSQYMNRNKKHKFWDVLSQKCDLEDSKENYYIVKVEGNKESTLTGKKVKCKSDDYVIKADFSRNDLLQTEYQITEKMLEEVANYEIIKNSGISVKRADSKKYTIVKLTKGTFKEAFENCMNGVEFIIVGLLIYTEEKNLQRNKKILKDLGIKEDDIKLFYLTEYGISGEGILEKKFAKKISEKSKSVVKEVIESNPKLKARLFKGEEWFENPYFIEFIFRDAQLTQEIYTDYIISNGSGRSKGNYTIILKPKR